MRLPLFKSLRDYFVVLFGSGFARGVALLNALIIARMLGPANFGIFSIFFAVMILTWQLPQAFDGVFVAYAKQYDSVSEKKDLLKTTVVLKFLYLGVVLLLSFPLARVLAVFCFQKPEAFLPLLVALVSGGCLMFLMTVAAIFQEEERFGRFALANAFYTVSIFVFLVFLYIVQIPLTLTWAISIYVSVSLIVGTSCIIILLRRVGNLLMVNHGVLKAAFAQGKWIFVMVAAACIFSRIDVLFLTRFVGFKSLGIYAVAAQLVLIVDMACGSLSGICLPKAGNAVRSRAAFKAFFKESIWVILFIECGILALILLSPYAVVLLYGDQYASAGNVLQILLCGWIFRVVFIPFSFLFVALGDSKTRFLLEFCKLVVGVALLYLLAPRFGLSGAAYAISSTYLFETIISITVLRYRLTRTYKELCLTS
jgi:O-antigen/teichoic acid export membrane protein